MRSRVAAIAACAVAAAAPATGRLHRLHAPPSELPRALTVDEKEWAVQPSKTLLGSGVVRIRAYDRGQDSHNLVIIDSSGRVRGTAALLSGGSATIVTRLPPGTYRLFCSLFAGTPDSHDERGMHAYVTVR